MMKRILRPSKSILLSIATLSLLCAAWTPFKAMAQDNNKWYIGGDAGIVLGNSTLRSCAADKMRPGYGLGLLVGYRINPFLSTEAELKYAHLSLNAYDCCKNLWLGSDGNRYYAPMGGISNYLYSEMQSRVNLYELSLKLNIDFLRMFTPDSRWSILLSPGIQGIGSTATLKNTNDDTNIHKSDFRTHLGIGADLGVGYQLTQRLNLRLYSGMVYVTGKSLDALPQTEHKANYLWNTGVKLTFSLGATTKNKKASAWKEAPVETSTAIIDQTTAPVTETQPIEKVATEKVVETSNTETPATVLPAESPSAGTPVASIYFSHNQYLYIEKSQYAVLGKILKALEATPDTPIDIVGWADKTGTGEVNDRISTRRAETLKRYLIKKGIAESRITIRGKGVDTQATTDNEARRAETLLLITEKE